MRFSHSTRFARKDLLLAIYTAVALSTCVTWLASCKAEKADAGSRIQSTTKIECEASDFEKFHSMIDESYADRVFVVLTLYSRIVGHPPSSLQDVVKEGYLPLPPSYVFRYEKGNELVSARSDIQLKYNPVSYTLVSYYASLPLGADWDSETTHQVIYNPTLSPLEVGVKAGTYAASTRELLSITDKRAQKTVYLASIMQALVEGMDKDWRQIQKEGHFPSLLHSICYQLGFLDLKDPYTGNPITIATDRDKMAKARLLAVTEKGPSDWGGQVSLMFIPLDENGQPITIGHAVDW